MPIPAPPKSSLPRSGPPDVSTELPAELAGIARLRSLRIRPERDLSLTREFGAAQVELRRIRRGNRGVAQAWSEVVPTELACRTELKGVASGALTVSVADSATRYDLDRFLRSGGEAAVLRACIAGIRRIKVVMRPAAAFRTDGPAGPPDGMPPPR